MIPSQSITITVSTVHAGPLGGAVFTGQDDCRRRVRAVADRNTIFRAPKRGEVWQLAGSFRRHRKYGFQFYVEQARLLRPKGDHLIRHLATHPAYRGFGFGTAHASRLFSEFGERLLTLLDEGDIQSLTKVLDEYAAHNLVEAWKVNDQEASTVMFLEKYGIDSRLANKIVRCWPKDAADKLKENPYRLLALAQWPAADQLALALGVGVDDDRRLIAAAEASVYDRLDTAKDTLVHEQYLIKDIERLLRNSDRGTSRKAVELACADNSLMGDRDNGYQSLGCVVMERTLKDCFEAMACNKPRQLPLLGGGTGRANIDTLILDFERTENIALNVEQRAAVHMAATEPLSVLKGGAGVGKTTVLRAVNHLMEAMNGIVIQMALSGRAAQRMREVTGREAYTIAGFLNRVRSEKIKLGGNHLLVIDESSMLDLMLMYRVARVLPATVRLLLVGDPYQLPPIGPGLVFHVMAESLSLPIHELKQVHRQAESTGIPQIAARIRSGVVPELARFSGLGTGVSFQDAAPSFIPECLSEIVSSLGGFRDLQIIGVVRNGTSGVISINQMFHQKLSAAKRRLNGWGIAESDPVIYTVNDYDRDLYNGSLGQIEKIYSEPQKPAGEEEQYRIMCDFDGRKVGLSDAELGNIELAYAITTHKAQGSQFKRVVVPITKSRLLDRTLIYTALTRGIEQVVFVGERRAFTEAIIDSPIVSRREVGFKI